MPRLRIIAGAALVALLAVIGVAHAGSPSSYPAASQPLGGYVGGPGTPDYVLMDQGAGCPTTTPCATVQSPSIRIGQPIQANCSSIPTPFTLQLCYDTSVNPNILKRWTGSAWVAVISALSAATEPVASPLAVETNQGSGCSSGSTPCADVQVPHPYLQVPMQTNCTALTLTFNYEPCLSTSFSPPLLMTYSSALSTWLPDINFWPAATSPIDATVTLRATQGTGCATGNFPCKDVSVTAAQISTPIATDCETLTSPSEYEFCVDTSVSPPELKTYINGTWSPVGAYDTTNDVWTPPVGQGIVATLASSGTTDLGSVPQSSITITGSSTITSFGASATVGNIKFLRFAGPVTLVGSSALILPNGGGQTVLSTTGNTHSSTTLDNLGSIAGLAPGQVIIASGVQAGTTIISIGSDSVVMSAAATSALTGIAVTFETPYTNQLAAAGDTALALYTGGGNWIVVVYQGVAGTGSFVTGPANTTAGDAAIWVGGTKPALLDAGAPPNLAVPSNAALRALSASNFAAGSSVYRVAFYPGSTMGGAQYTLSASNCSAADNGSQVQPLVGTGCWIWDVPSSAEISPAMFGATGSSFATTGTAGATSTAMTLAAAGDFQNSMPIACFGCGTAFSLTQPTGVTLSAVGSGGGHQWCVKVLPIDAGAGWGNISSEVCANGAASLNSPTGTTPENGMLASWSSVSGAASYAIYIGASGAEVYAAVTTQTSWTASGQCTITQSCGAAYNTPSWIPLTPPTGSQGDLQVNSIVSGAGTVNIVLGTATISAVTNAIIQHDDTAAINAALATGYSVKGAQGTYNVTSTINFSATRGQLFSGCGRRCFDIVGYGVFNILTQSSSPSSLDQSFREMEIDGSNMAGGFAVLLNESPFYTCYDILINLPYDGLETSGSATDGVCKYFEIYNETRGDSGVLMQSSDATAPSGIQRYDNLVIAKMYQGNNIQLNGHVPTIEGNFWTVGIGPNELVINNSVGAATPPQFLYVHNMGLNGCWDGCVDNVDGIDIEVDIPYFQDFDNGGTDGSTNTVFFGGSADYMRFSGGQVFGGGNAGVNANGNMFVSDGTLIHGNGVAAIICNGNGLTVNGGGNVSTGSNFPSEQYGVWLRSTCTQASVAGNWLGTTAGVLDSTGLAGQAAVQGWPLGSPTGTVTASSGTTIGASMACAGWNGSFSITYRSGPTANFSDTGPTGGTCQGEIPNGIVGSTFTWKLVNETNKQWTLQPGSNWNFTGDAVTSSNVVIPGGSHTGVGVWATCFGEISPANNVQAFCTLLK